MMSEETFVPDNVMIPIEDSHPNLTSSCTQNNPTENHAQSPSKAQVNQIYSLKVKPEFLQKNVPSTFVSSEPTKLEQTDQVNDDSRNEKRSKKEKRGQNKKRPRDIKKSHDQKACLAIIRGESCPFGASCKFIHDLKELLANRPEDLNMNGERLECPHWKLKGFCPFGLMCRLGSCHINMSTGENLSKTYGSEGNESISPPIRGFLGHKNDVMNVLSKDTSNKLRKNQYPFVCKRYSGANKQNANSSGMEELDVSHDISSNMPALPPKERKLIDFRNKVYVAPLTTVGNLPFRRIMKSFGADITCGEMALADQLLQGKSSEWALLKRHPCEDIFGVQIASGHADQYTRVAELLASEEGFHVDFVDMNLGCPIDLVCEKGAGASLMLREKKLRGSLEGMTKVLNCPVTIKIRTGWDEKKNIAHLLVPTLQKWGIDGIGAIMIHGRSRLQRYSRLANWSYIFQVANSQSPEIDPIPIIGNGDIFSYIDYDEKVLKYIDDVDVCCKNNLLRTAMLGRGALIKPWLPTEIKERRHWDISATERFEILKDFVRHGLEHWGSDQQGVNNTRRFLLEWLSFLHRYVPVGMLEVIPQQMNQRPPNGLCGRSDLETLMLSKNCADWIKISEMLLGPVPENFEFEPKHKANSYN